MEEAKGPQVGVLHEVLRVLFVAAQAQRQDVEVVRMALKLYHFEACPYCEKVRSVLRRMDLRFESVEIDPADRSAVKAVSGQEKVPVLADGDMVVHDSTRILRYLVRTYGGGRFLPDDAHSRGLMWILDDYVDEALIPL